MAYGQTHTATMPTVGVTAGTSYATLINAAIAELRASLDAKVTPAGIDINADLTMRSGATYSALTNAHSIGMTSQGSLLAAADYPGRLFVSATGELYYNDTSGQQIQVTSAGAVSGTPGSITGAGYGTPVEVNWSAADQWYSMYLDSSASPATFAHVRMNDLLLNDGDANFLRMAVGAMSGDYTLTWPSAVAGANGTLLQSTTAGVLSWSNTGLASVSLSSGAHFTVSGSGRFKHGTVSMPIPAAACVVINGSTGQLNESYWQLDAADDRLYAPIMLPVGSRIVSIAADWRPAGGTSPVARVYRVSGGTATSINSASMGGSAGVWSTNTAVLTGGSLPYTTITGEQYFVEFDAGQANDRLGGWFVSYDLP